MGGGFIIYFKTVVPEEDFTLSIVFENDDLAIRFPMLQLINLLRFSPLKDMNVWRQVEIYPTHLEWNKGDYPVSLNIEEIVPM